MSIYRLHIALESITPKIWRQVEVPDTYTLSDLHTIIQIAMGWSDDYMHRFAINGKKYAGGPYGEKAGGKGDLDDSQFTLEEALGKQTKKFSYTYDFDDSWDHEIVVEKMSAPDEDITYPICLGGERACPPEDCGGVSGYNELLLALKNPEKEEYQELLELVGEDYNPEEFDLEEVNEALEELGEDLCECEDEDEDEEDEDDEDEEDEEE